MNSATKLIPTVTTEAEMGNVAFDGVRRRPVVAINEEGKLVVCSRKTAAKHAWKIEGVMFQRGNVGKQVAPAKPARRAMDKDGSVVVDATKVKKVAKVSTTLAKEVADILSGKK